LQRQIDGDGGATKLGVSRGRSVWLIQAAKARNICGQFEDAAIVYLVDHPFGLIFDGYYSI
jgi:hypothetical protein